MNIYVGNLAHSATEETLRPLFEQFGEIVSIKIITDRLTGRPRGFAFVQMSSNEEAQNAINKLNGYELEGRKLTVNEARPRPKREGQGGGGPRSRFNRY